MRVDGRSGAPAPATPHSITASRPARPGARLPPGVLAIGASTGGPHALVHLLRGLADVTRAVPTCVTLHMLPGLMPFVAANLARQCRLETRVVDGPCRLRPGPVYFAPGDKHLRFDRHGGHIDLALVAAPPHGHCKPAIDTMFTAAAAVFRARTLCVVLSGMGEDGLVGAGAIVREGGTVLVQDQASSAVWGMPGAVAKAGLATAVLPPGAIAAEVVRRVRFAAVPP